MSKRDGLPKGVPIQLKLIVPNRLNPNQMDWGNRFLIREAMAVDDYDPIVVSPATVFYGEEAYKIQPFISKDPDGLEYLIGADEAYIICDGQHRYEEAWEAGLKTIRCLIWHISEKDAMAHFYKRHKTRGELDPLKEAELFWHERHINKLSRDEIVKRYGLPGIGYLKSRLKITNLSAAVAELFYDPLPDCGRSLTIADIQELIALPRALQEPVAIIALQRKWTAKDIRSEIRRIKALKGLTSPQAYVPPPDGIPPPRPETRMEKVARPTPDKRPDLASKEPVPDKKIFEEYPAKIIEKMEETPPPSISQTLAEKRIDDRAPKVIPIPVSWKPEVTAGDRVSPLLVQKTLPPRIMGRSLVESFLEEVFVMAAEEGLDLNSDKDGKSIGQYLREGLDEEVFNFLDKRQRNALLRIVLRAFQLWVLEIG